MPLQRGGTNKRTNLTTVCRPCHNDSHDQQVSDPNTGTKDERWLSAVDEVRELVRTTHHPLKRAVIGLLAKTGIGVGELCNIQLRDVFFSDTDVSEAYGIGKPEWVQGSLPSIRIRAEGKETYSPQRERVGTTHIPFDNQTRRILKRWLAIRPDSHQSPRPLFLSTQSGGDRLSLMTVHALVKSQAISLGFADDDSELNSLTPYTLRYFFLNDSWLNRPSVSTYSKDSPNLCPLRRYLHTTRTIYSRYDKFYLSK